MKVKTITKEIYTFAELSESAQQTAIEHRMEVENNMFDGEAVYENAAEVASLFGLDIRVRTVQLNSGKSRHNDPAIYYSGFGSQGDGACFEGNYNYQKGAYDAVKSYAPQDEELHRIVKELQTIQAKNFYQLAATCKHSRQYYHSGCMDVDVTRKDYKEMTEDAEETLTQLLRDFADYIYKQLEADYDYITGKGVIEYLNECYTDFDVNGEIA